MGWVSAKGACKRSWCSWSVRAGRLREPEYGEAVTLQTPRRGWLHAKERMQAELAQLQRAREAAAAGAAAAQLGCSEGVHRMQART